MNHDATSLHQIKLSYGGLTLELSGSPAFVESQAEHWWRRLQPFLNAPEVDTPQEALPRISTTFQPTCNVTVSEFLKLKAAQAPEDILVTVAYYLEKYNRREHYQVLDLQRLLAQAPEAACLAIDTAVELALTKGHLEHLPDGSYTLTYRGQAYVREGLSE